MAVFALFEMGQTLLVFAENGVWQIQGVDGVFKAGEFSVSRVSGSDGITNSASLLSLVFRAQMVLRTQRLL
jgi:hypothetical protein